MKNNDCLFFDIQNLCNAVSDWLIKKSIIQLKPTRQYPVPVVTSCVITAEPVKRVTSEHSELLAEDAEDCIAKFTSLVRARD